jgi:pSer/pThr/pTyr-binding forkhead associated (FHA) protein
MDVKLVLEKGAHKAQVFKLRSRETVIGRRQGCHLRVPADSVSRRHCRLIFHNDYLVIEDLASVNGTYVNGVLIAGRTIVHPGDRITIGSLTFLVKYQLTPKAIERLLDEKQKEGELLPTFDANESSLPVALADADEEAPKATKYVGDRSKDISDSSLPVPLPEPKRPTPPSRRKTKKPSPKKAKPMTKKKKTEEPPPDASAILEGYSWQLPTGEDIRDILSQLEKEK